MAIILGIDRRTAESGRVIFSGPSVSDASLRLAREYLLQCLQAQPNIIQDALNCVACPRHIEQPQIIKPAFNSLVSDAGHNLHGPAIAQTLLFLDCDGAQQYRGFPTPCELPSRHSQPTIIIPVNT